MGFTYANAAAKRKHMAQLAEEQRKRTDMRINIASKIAMVFIDKVNNDLIRPGPDAEERECYVMSQELRDMEPDFVSLIVKILDNELEKYEL